MSDNIELLSTAGEVDNTVNNDTREDTKVDGMESNDINTISIENSSSTSPQPSIDAKENILLRVLLPEETGYPYDAKIIISKQGKDLGFINSEGNIIQKNNKYFTGHSIGRIKDNYHNEAVTFYVTRFTELFSKYEKLLEELNNNQFKSNFLDKVHELIEFIPVSTALGDFDLLIDSLKKLESDANEKFLHNLEEKNKLCEEAEKLSDSINWKETTEGIKNLQEKWKSIGPVSIDETEILWSRFRGAIDKYFERLKLYYEGLDKERQQNLIKKELLCERAEILSSSSDWRNTNEELKRMQKEWKKIGPVPVLHSDLIWNRFRVAQDKFYERLKIHFEEVDAQRNENLKKKEELCVIAELLMDSTVWRKTAGELKKLQELWKLIGPAPIEHSDIIWKRFKTAIDKFYIRFREHMAEIDKERKINFEKKEQLCLQAEAFSKSTNWNETTEALKKLQLEWKEIGPAPDNVSQQIWERFRKAMDDFFERRREFFVQRSKALKQKSETWQTRLRESLQRKNEQLSRLKELIKLDEINIEKLNEKINSLSGGNGIDQKNNIENKIADIQESLNSKLEKLKEYEDSIKDIGAKL